MKCYSFLLIFCSFIAFNVSASENATNTVKTLLSQSKRIVIPTQGMTCMGCAAQVKDSLKNITGVNNISVDLVKRTVTVDYNDDKFDPSVAVKKIKDLGYKPGEPRTEVK
jgi:copper chaperone CopZ